MSKSEELEKLQKEHEICSEAEEDHWKEMNSERYLKDPNFDMSDTSTQQYKEFKELERKYLILKNRHEEIHKEMKALEEQGVGKDTPPQGKKDSSKKASSKEADQTPYDGALMVVADGLQEIRLPDFGKSVEFEKRYPAEPKDFKASKFVYFFTVVATFETGVASGVEGVAFTEDDIELSAKDEVNTGIEKLSSEIGAKLSVKKLCDCLKKSDENKKSPDAGFKKFGLELQSSVKRSDDLWGPISWEPSITIEPSRYFLKGSLNITGEHEIFVDPKAKSGLRVKGSLSVDASINIGLSPEAFHDVAKRIGPKALRLILDRIVIPGGRLLGTLSEAGALSIAGTIASAVSLIFAPWILVKLKEIEGERYNRRLYCNPFLADCYAAWVFPTSQIPTPGGLDEIKAKQIRQMAAEAAVGDAIDTTGYMGAEKNAREILRGVYQIFVREKYIEAGNQNFTKDNLRHWLRNKVLEQIENEDKKLW